MPWLTYPLGLLGLVAVPALIGLYVLQRRHRKIPVSSLLLWQIHVLERHGGRSAQRLKTPLSFFLELLVLLLLLLALIEPRWHRVRTDRPVLVVLDDSASLQARQSDGKTTAERAVEYLSGMFRFRPRTPVRLVLAGDTPRVDRDSIPAAQLDARLSAWRPAAPASDLEAAISLAQQMVSAGARILVISDRKPDREYPGVPLRWVAVGEANPNLAIVNATLSRFESESRCFLEIANFSGANREVGLHVREDVPPTRLTVPARRRVRVTRSLPATTTRLAPKLIVQDALDADNAVVLLAAPQPQVRVATRLLDKRYADLFRKSLLSTGLYVHDTDNPQVAIADRFIDPADLPRGCWILNVHRAPEPRAYVGPFVQDLSHPLCEGLQLEGVVWAAGEVTLRTDESPVIMAGNVLLLAERVTAAGERRLRLNLTPDYSTVQRTPNWPILLWNLLRLRAGQAPGFQEPTVRLGTVTRFVPEADMTEFTLVRPDDSQVRMTGVAGAVRVPMTQTGIYRVTGSARIYETACNLLSPAESDLGACTTGNWGDWQETEMLRQEYAATTWLFLLLAAAALTAHAAFVLTARTRRTGGLR